MTKPTPIGQKVTYRDLPAEKRGCLCVVWGCDNFACFEVWDEEDEDWFPVCASDVDGVSGNEEE